MDFARPSQSIAVTILSGLMMCNPPVAANTASAQESARPAADPAVVTADAGHIASAVRTAGAGGVSAASDIRQVVGKQLGGRRTHSSNSDSAQSSGGFLSGLFGRGSSSEDKVVPTQPGELQGGTDDVNWDGVPYHSVNPRGRSQTAATPNRSASVAARTAPPVRRSGAGSNLAPPTRSNDGLQIPQPPADSVGIASPRSSVASSRRSEPSRSAATGSIGGDDSSAETSSRRTSRRVVTTAASSGSANYAASVGSEGTVNSVHRPDYSDVADLVPRVSRRSTAKPATAATAEAKPIEMPKQAATSKPSVASISSVPTNAAKAAVTDNDPGKTSPIAGTTVDSGGTSSASNRTTQPTSGLAKLPPPAISSTANNGNSGALPGSDSAATNSAATSGSTAGQTAANQSAANQSAAGQRYNHLGFVGGVSPSAQNPPQSADAASPSVPSHRFAADPFSRPAGATPSPAAVHSSNSDSQSSAGERREGDLQFQSPYRTASAPIGSGLSGPRVGTATAALTMPPALASRTLPPVPSEVFGQPTAADAAHAEDIEAGRPTTSIALAAPIAGNPRSGTGRTMSANSPDAAMPSGSPSPILRDQMSQHHWNENATQTEEPEVAVHNQGRPAKDPSSLAGNVMRSETSEQPSTLPTGQNAVSSELPGIRVTTMGPEWMMIRQTREYEIRVENRGAIDAEGVLVRTLIPNWAELQGNSTTLGEVEKESSEAEERLVWTIDHLPAGKSETLTVRLNAARSGTYHMNVNWTLMPRKSVTQIEVREPKLKLSIDGPDEVVYGESATYQVRILNPGDGVAPNVMFVLSPDTAPQTQRIGDIPPGKEAQFDVELTAQDLQDLKVRGLATGDLDLRTEAGKTIKVLSAKLIAEFNGPEVKYQDSEAMYGLTVSNNGTATSEAVVAQLKLPSGVEYVGGIDAAQQQGRVLKWNIDSLPVGTAIDYEFRCMMKATGDQAFVFDARGTAAGATEVSLNTAVESIADLVLSIKDPPAPAPIGNEVTYEIAIRNRGSRAAKDVRAVAQFSRGIEPQRILGQTGQIVTGQVLFDSIPLIAAGEEVVLQVIAIAETGGHHRFRSEVTSGEVVLVAEEATHYMNGNSQRVSRRSEPTSIR